LRGQLPRVPPQGCISHLTVDTDPDAGISARTSAGLTNYGNSQRIRWPWWGEEAGADRCAGRPVKSRRWCQGVDGMGWQAGCSRPAQNLRFVGEMIVVLQNWALNLIVHPHLHLPGARQTILACGSSLLSSRGPYLTSTVTAPTHGALRCLAMTAYVLAKTGWWSKGPNSGVSPGALRQIH
jgi:hypothetical protein